MIKEGAPAEQKVTIREDYSCNSERSLFGRSREEEDLSPLCEQVPGGLVPPGLTFPERRFCRGEKKGKKPLEGGKHLEAEKILKKLLRGPSEKPKGGRFPRVTRGKAATSVVEEEITEGGRRARGFMIIAETLLSSEERVT